MEKRAMIALALSMAVFVVFMYIGQRSRVGQVSPTQESQQTRPSPSKPNRPKGRWPRLPPVRRPNRRWPRLRSRPSRAGTWWWRPLCFGRYSPMRAAA